MNRLMVCLIALLLWGGISASSPAKAQLNVPVYGQQWQPWAPRQLGRGSYTIGGSGCVITSAAMVRSYFGDTKNPWDMNNWLLSHNGFSGSNTIISAIQGYAGSRDYTNVAADLKYINSLLDQGYLIIAMTYFPPSRTITHFVVITGHSGKTYYINDPWYGDRSTFNSRYGDPGRWIYNIYIFRR